MTMTALVTDGEETWRVERKYMFYTKHEAKKLFNKYLKSQGWKRI